MDKLLQDAESENNQLCALLKEKEIDIERHVDRISLLEKALDKEKKFHRKFADEVASSEAIRLSDFNKEKQSNVEEIKRLKKINVQLAKDVTFYKMAHEELARFETEGMVTTNSQKQNPISTSESECQTVSNGIRTKKQKNSNPVVKVNLSLFEENKKLQLKIKDISTSVAELKKKNKQLENFRKKIENKKSKFHRDLQNLQKLVDKSKTKNKDKFTPDVLNMLNNLATNKRV